MRAYCCCWLALWGCAVALAATVPTAAPVEETTAGGMLQTSAPETDDLAPMALWLSGSSDGLLYRGHDGSLPPECFEEGAVCIPKCCALGSTLVDKKCVPTNDVFDPYVRDERFEERGRSLLEWERDDYSIVIGNPCKKRYFREQNDLVDVLSSGILYLYENNETDKHWTINATGYCLEYSATQYTIAIVCDDPDAKEISRAFTNWLYTSGMLVSVSGLLLTLVVYLSVESLRDLHGKSLICHVGCLAVAYILLAAVQLNGDSGFSHKVCRRFAFAIQFFLLSSFLWLHVMCLDALWCVLEATKSSPVPYPRAKKWEYDEIKKQWVTGLDMEILDEAKEKERKLRDKRVERRVFAGYSVYVWIMSLLPVLVVLIHNLSPTIPATYVDHNMQEYCEMYGKKSAESLLYFYPLSAFIIFINIIIFICILIKAVPFKWNVTGPHRVPKQKARMVFFLFVLMSSNWVMDLISWQLGGKQVVWVMLHAFYILQGLITFLIFVLEDRVKDRIIHKLWPRVRRINREFVCCHRPTSEEEVTALRDNGPSPNKLQTVGWIANNH